MYTGVHNPTLYKIDIQAGFQRISTAPRQVWTLCTPVCTFLECFLWPCCHSYLLTLIFRFAESIRNQNGKVLVHCKAGISRSATICLAYLITCYRLSLDEAYEFMKKRKSLISPNFSFLGQLLNLESNTNLKCENKPELAQTPFISKKTPRSPFVKSSAENTSSEINHTFFAYPPTSGASCSVSTCLGVAGTGAVSPKLLFTPT